MSFYISKLVVTGPSVEPAILEFKPGFNMIDGPSNTGKSYVHHCLNFMMGGGDIPEIINEAIGYTEALLEIIDDAGQYHCFRRSLSGGDFELAKTSFDKFEKVERQVYKWKHNKLNDNTISSYLLTLSGYSQVEIKQNRYNKKRTLSFRDIAKLIIINEESIITKRSPLATNQKVSTEEFSIFSFLITGLDAKHLIEREEPEIRKGKLRAQIDLIDSLLNLKKDQKIQNEKIDNNNELLLQLTNEIKNLLTNIHQDTLQRFNLETQRKHLWEQLQKVKSEEILEEEIFKRFSILSEQYEKDLKRLAFLTEGNELLSYLKTSNCPLCGRTEDHSHAELDGKEMDVISIKGAYDAERNKILLKNADLAQAINNLKISINQKALEYLKIHDEIIAIDVKIKNELEPSIMFQKDNLQQLITKQNEVTLTVSSNNAFGLQAKRDNLVQQLKVKDSGDTEANLSTIGLQALCDIIADLLKEWDYSDEPKVYFDQSKKDIVISGKARSSDGKGYRAITYSAFVLGLLNYCREKLVSHPGFLILDSPMTAYKKKDYDPLIDKIPEDIENSFFENLCNISNDKQIIILDNKTLTDEQKAKTHYQHFTGNHRTGRYGFFPSNSRQ